MHELVKSIGSKTHPNLTNHIFIQRVRAQFNYLAITNEIMVPFLKGMHNAIDGWQENRDHEGWRNEGSHWKEVLENYLYERRVNEKDYDALIGREEGD